MRISPISSNNRTSQLQYKKYNYCRANQSVCSSSNIDSFYSPSFKSLKYQSGRNDFCDTSFYRDLPTLVASTQILHQEFPKGTDILDFASSNGEEAISLYTLLHNKNNAKYNIHCFDKSQNVIDIANNGVYTVYSCGSDDAFLYKDFSTNFMKDFIKIYLGGIKEEFSSKNKSIDSLQYLAKKQFNEIMEPIQKPSFEINDVDFINYMEQMFGTDFKLKHYKINDKYKDNFKFNVGDIQDIDKILPDKKVGAVLFRNAFYILTDNYALNEFDYVPENNVQLNKQKVIEGVVSKVYEKLSPGGLFILGDNQKDHIYLADDSLKENEKLFIYDYYAEVYRKSPLESALEKDNRFKPVFKKTINTALGEIEITTIWQKN